MKRVLVVDDEAPARQRLIRMLAGVPDLEVVGEADNGVRALEEIARLVPDVVFLDIAMPELNGLDVARVLNGGPPAVIFVTAYDEHALAAFDAQAVDYLVKPVNASRLGTALEKLRRLEPSCRDERLLAALANLEAQKQTPLARLAVRCGARFLVLDPACISAALATDDYSEIVEGERRHLVDESLEELLIRLDPTRFVRVHRSAIINLDFLKQLEREGDRRFVAVLTDHAETRVTVSRERWMDLKKRLGIRR